MPKSSLLLVVLLLFSACSSSRHADESSKVPEDLRIELGAGGGFAGIWTGYTVLASGGLLEWKGALAGAGAKPVGTLVPDTVRAWWRTIRQGRIMERSPVHKGGNYVQMLSITAAGSTVGFSWPPAEDADSTFAGVAAFRARCLHAVQGALHR